MPCEAFVYYLACDKCYSMIKYIITKSVPLTKLLTLFDHPWDQSYLRDSGVFPEDQGKYR